jgi:hypothetical protein
MNLILGAQLKVGRNNIAPHELPQLLAFSQVFGAMPYGYCALRPKLWLRQEVRGVSF